MLHAVQTTTALPALPALPATPVRLEIPPYVPSAHADERDQRELARLRQIVIEVRAAEFRERLKEGIAVREEAIGLGRSHAEMEHYAVELKKAGAHPDKVEEAGHLERRAFEILDARRDDLQEAAQFVLEAPVSAASDILLRAEAYTLLIDCAPGDDGLPDAAEDLTLIVRSFREALQRMVDDEGDRAPFDAAVAAYSKNERRLTDLNRQDDDHLEGRITLEDHVARQLEADLKATYEARDVLADALLALDPPDVGGLLEQMIIVFDRGFVTDVSSYAVRNRMMMARTDDSAFPAPLSVDRMQADDEFEEHRRGLAVLAHRAAKLRDRDLPSDWRDIWQSTAWVHTNGADATRRAFEAGMLSANFSGVQLAHAPDEKLPVLSFGRDFVTPQAAFVWQPVQ